MVISPWSAAVRPKTMPPSICAATSVRVARRCRSPPRRPPAARARAPSPRDRHLGHLGDEAAERLVHGDAARPPGRQRRAPAGLLGGQLEHARGGAAASPAARAAARRGRGRRRRRPRRGSTRSTKAFCELATERHQPTGTPGSWSDGVHLEVGDGVGQVLGAVDRLSRARPPSAHAPR